MIEKYLVCKKKGLRQATSRRKGTQGCCLVKMWHYFSCGVLGPSFEFLVSKEGETFTRNSEAGPLDNEKDMFIEIFQSFSNSDIPYSCEF